MVAVGPKTWNATITAVDGDAVTLDVRSKWVNYHDGGGIWLPIDPSFTDISGGGFEHTTSPWSVSCPRYATGRISVYNDQDYNPHTGSTLSLTTTPALELDHPDASPVEGIIDPERPWRVVYPNALGDKVDLAAGLWQGRYTRAEHLVIIRGLPAGDMDAVITERIYTPLRIPGWSGSAADVGATGAALLAAGDPDLGIRMRPAVAWYYDQSGQLVTCPISVVVERRLNAGYVLLTKTIPRWFIADALAAGAYVIADETTTTFYPNANVETTSVDGSALRNANETFPTIRAEAGMASQDSDTAASCFLSCSATTSQYQILQRLFFLFDTSAIGSGNTVTAATLSLYALTKSSGNGVIEAAIVSSLPASNTAIVAADYSTLGTTDFAPRLTSTAATTSAYNDFVLNSSGLAAISTTSITKLGCRPGVDVDAGTPPWTSNAFSRIEFSLADTTGTTRDPKFVVTYTAGGGGGGTSGNLLLLGVG